MCVCVCGGGVALRLGRIPNCWKCKSLIFIEKVGVGVGGMHVTPPVHLEGTGRFQRGGEKTRTRRQDQSSAWGEKLARHESRVPAVVPTTWNTRTELPGLLSVVSQTSRNTNSP